MQITIQSHQLQLCKEELERMENMLLLSIGRFSRAIKTVRIRLTDTNGPKGGYDKECLIVVKLRDGGEVVIQGGGENSGGAMRRCADRLTRAVERKVKLRQRRPIQRIRRQKQTEREAALVEDDQIHEQVESDQILLCAPDGRGKYGHG